eukprot:Nk52_evm45s248 gene=Nk52_evmTU45s248
MATEEIEKAVVLMGLAKVYGTRCEVSLTKHSLLWKALDNSKRAWETMLYDIFGVALSGNGSSFTVYGFPVAKGIKRVEQNVQFYCNQAGVNDDVVSAKEWVRCLNHVLKGVLPDEEIPRRNLLVYINPFGGKKKSMKLYSKHAAPMFELAGVGTEVIVTTHAGHASEHIKEADLKKYDGIITVGGDGLLHEVLNGLLHRDDKKQASKMPLGLLPAGSGNAMVRSLDINCFKSGVLIAIKGNHIPLDVMHVSQGTESWYSHLSLTWALIADIDIESEKYRWMGGARFTFAGIARILKLRKYKGSLSYLPHDSENTQEENSVDFPQPKYSLDANGNPPKNWEKIEADFSLFSAMNVGWINTDMFITPYASNNDGCIDIVYGRHEETKPTSLLSIMADFESGKHVHSPAIHYLKCKAFCLSSDENKGIMVVDGELMPSSKPVIVESLPSLCNVMCPAGFSLPAWKADESAPINGKNYHVKSKK